MNNEKIQELKRAFLNALREESVIRESAFLPITLQIAGINVNQFTFFHYVLLDFLDNAVLNGRDTVEDADILTFLWVVSTDYKPNNEEAFKDFVASKCFDLNYSVALQECGEYLNNAFLDIDGDTTPLSEDDERKKARVQRLKNQGPTYSWIATYVDLLASQYGWTKEYIMTLPVAQVFQYSRVIQERLMASVSDKKPQYVNKLSDAINVKLQIALGEASKELTNSEESKV